MTTKLGIVCLGASQYDYWPKKSNFRFKASCDLFLETIQNCKIYGNPEIDLLNLFDLDLGPGETTNEIVDFISQEKFNDIFVYYCGHGHLSKINRYHLFLRTTREKSLSTSTLQVQNLWQDIEASIRNKRLYVFIDACFAGAAGNEFMSADHERVVHNSIRADMPASGVGIIAATDAESFAIAREGSNFTVFTEAVAEVIKNGVGNLRQMHLCWRQIVAEARIRIADSQGIGAQRPTFLTKHEARIDVGEHPFVENEIFVRQLRQKAEGRAKRRARKMEVEKQRRAQAKLLDNIEIMFTNYRIEQQRKERVEKFEKWAAQQKIGAEHNQNLSPSTNFSMSANDDRLNEILSKVEHDISLTKFEVRRSFRYNRILRRPLILQSIISSILLRFFERVRYINQDRAIS